MTAKNRRELKQKFRTGAQPTAQDYADVFDSGFNGLDDGISKPLEPYLPVRIKGNGAGLHVLDLYNDDTHHWRISLTSDDDSGYNIADPTGNTHFFMEDGTGNIGLGISNPKAKLHINQDDTSGDALYVEDFANDATPTRITNAGNIYVRSEVMGEVDDANFYVNGDTRIVNDTTNQQFFHINRFGAASFNALTSAQSPQLDVHSPFNLHGAMLVNGDVEIKGKITVHQEMDVKSTASAQGGVIQLGDHNGDQVSLPGKLNSGDNDALMINDAADIGGSVYIRKVGNETEKEHGNLDVAGAAAIHETLNVDKALSALSASITQSVTAATFAGDGAALTNLTAGNIATGTVPFARLPTDNNESLGTSTSLLPTQDAVKKYVDAQIAALKTELKSYIDSHINTVATSISRVDGKVDTEVTKLENKLDTEVGKVNTRISSAKLVWGGVQITTENAYDSYFNKEFNSEQVMMGVESWHKNKHEDRQFRWRYRTLRLEID